jgi:hypothetical protein
MAKVDLKQLGNAWLENSYVCVDDIVDELRAARAVVDAARLIPLKPSPAHYLATPNWQQLNDAIKAFDDLSPCSKNT